MRALFLAMEGLDGSGGTTQCRLLREWFQANNQSDVHITNEPSGGPVGRLIRQLLQNTTEEDVGDSVIPYLFAADRRDHIDREIVPPLQRGAVVITDRYYHSSLAYQSLSVGLPMVARLNESFLTPDVTLDLDLSPEQCLERILARGEPLERFEALDRLRAVQEAYTSVMVHCRSHGEPITRIDANGSVEVVHQRIVAAIEERMATMSLPG